MMKKRPSSAADVGPFEMLQARQLLESNIAAFAAKMATKADIENLRRTLEQEQRAIAANDSSQDNDKLFHLLLAGASQNQMLLDTVTSIWRHLMTAARSGSSCARNLKPAPIA